MNSKFNSAEGSFTLKVAFDYNPVEGEIEYIVSFFEIVSLILKRATSGQHLLAPVEIVDFDPDNKEIDILINIDDRTNVYNSRFWNEGYIEYSRNHLYSPGLMLHELGHYLYDLGDEYLGCQKKRHKKGEKGSPTSIMEYSFGNNTRFKRIGERKEYKVIGGFDAFWSDLKKENCELIYKHDEVVTGFCMTTNDPKLKHDPVPRSEHNLEHENKSCWDVMILIQEYGLTHPPIDGFNKAKIDEEINEIKNNLLKSMEEQEV